MAQGPQSLFSENHMLQMLEEVQFDDITFGIFPRVGSSLSEAYGRWAQNSVGDVLDMLMQALEVWHARATLNMHYPLTSIRDFHIYIKWASHTE